MLSEMFLFLIARVRRAERLTRERRLRHKRRDERRTQHVYFLYLTTQSVLWMCTKIFTSSLFVKLCKPQHVGKIEDAIGALRIGSCLVKSKMFGGACMRSHTWLSHLGQFYMIIVPDKPGRRTRQFNGVPSPCKVRVELPRRCFSSYVAEIPQKLWENAITIWHEL